jgi:hypothetical protein
MLLSFDRTAKVKAVSVMHLKLMVELAVKQDQLFAAYLAMYHSIRTDTDVFPNPVLSQLCFMAASKGDAVLCQTIFSMGLHQDGQSVYQVLSTARASCHDALQQQLLYTLGQDSMHVRYGNVCCT